MSFRRYEITLPTRHNDGSPVAEENHLWVAEQLAARFGAYTFSQLPDFLRQFFQFVGFVRETATKPQPNPTRHLNRRDAMNAEVCSERLSLRPSRLSG